VCLGGVDGGGAEGVEDTGTEQHRWSQNGQRSNSVRRMTDRNNRELMERGGGAGGTVLRSVVAPTAGNGGGGRRRRGIRRQWQLQAVGGGTSNRKIDPGGQVVIIKLVHLSQNQFTESGEKRKSTARSTFTRSAMKFQVLAECHGFIFRRTSFKITDCDVSRMQNEVGRRRIGT